MSAASDRSEDARIVLVTAPDRAAAETLARALIERRVAACVNVLDGVTSIYRWRGAIEEAREALLVAKTSAARYPEFERALHELHPYEVPECIALAPRDLAPQYRAWLFGELS